MKFGEYVEYPRLMQATGQGGVNFKTVHDAFISAAEKSKDPANELVGVMSAMHNMAVEDSWMAKRRPYYTVYPDIIPALLRVSLDVSLKDVSLPIDPMLIRLPVSAVNEDLPIQSVLVTFAIQECEREAYMKIGEELSPELRDKLDSVPPMLRMYAIPGKGFERKAPNNVIAWSPYAFNLADKHGHTIEELVRRVDGVIRNDDLSPHDTDFTLGCHSAESLERVLSRIVVACSLLADNPDVVIPEVLSKDAAKFAETGDQKYVDKAVRRGKIGWSIGKSYHEARKSPGSHFRIPHFAVRWMGRGDNKKPVLRPIKGSWVNKDKMTDIPTGYLDDETHE